jgi:hypothetical protein
MRGVIVFGRRSSKLTPVALRKTLTLTMTPTLDDIAPARDRIGAIVEERPYPGGVAQVGMGEQPKLALEVW